MKKFNILIIDNNDWNRSALQEMLVANDFLVKTVSNSEEGLHLLTNETFDMVFIDTEMNSFHTCQTIKADAGLRGTPVIFIVDRNKLILVNEIYESGGDDYITTPFVWGELLTKARIHLELKYSRKMSKNMNQILEAKVNQRTIELEESLTNLVQAKKELELLSIAKIEFLNLISHEIRTPLNGILGSLALIGRYNYTDEVNRYFSLLDTSVKRLEKFSNTILEASTLRLKGDKSLIMIKIDIAKVISHAIDQCTEKFSEKAIQLKIRNNTTNSFLKGDHRYLLKCLTAVLDNAFKFSFKGETVEIDISNEDNGFLKITIIDHGKGFSKVAMDNIYKPLSNLEAHFDQNTGMGLHLAKLIIDAHSGSISAGNHEPNGAIIEIKIPSKL